MRIHVVTPKAPVNVTLNPRVQPAPNPCPTFITGIQEPVRLSQSSYWILRLPYPLRTTRSAEFFNLFYVYVTFSFLNLNLVMCTTAIEGRIYRPKIMCPVIMVACFLDFMVFQKYRWIQNELNTFTSIQGSIVR